MAEMTERLLVDAGIAPGMRVLDVGCGRGDVSFLVAGLVGERGEVLGVDRDPRALHAARERLRELGLANVAFTEGDLGLACVYPGGCQDAVDCGSNPTSPTGAFLAHCTIDADAGTGVCATGAGSCPD